jgi:hypothetical protein
LDYLAQNFGIRLLAEGGDTKSKSGNYFKKYYFEEIFSAHKLFGGRQNEFDLLNEFIDQKCGVE